MPDKRIDQREKAPQGSTRPGGRDDLRQERRLVRSAGTISKPVMAMAFGLVFLLIAALVAVPQQLWIWSGILGAIGAFSVAWAIYAWGQGSHRKTRQIHGSQPGEDEATN